MSSSSSSARYHAVPESADNMDFENSDLYNGPHSTGRRIPRRPVPQPPTSPDVVSPVSPHAAPGFSAFPPPPVDLNDHSDDVPHRINSTRNPYSDSHKVYVPPSDSDGSDASKLVVQPTGRDKIYVPYDHQEYYAKGSTVSDAMERTPSSTSREKIPVPGIPFGEDSGLIPVDNRDKRKRLWLILGAIGLVLIIVGAVLGGVLGTRQKGGGGAKQESFSRPSDSSIPTSSATLNSLLTAASIPKPTPSANTTLCPTEMGFCTDGTCAGQNGVEGKNGTCMEGQYKGCACKSICSTANDSGPCDYMNCAGINDPLNGLGVCTGGVWWGCYCGSLCGNAIGSCTSNGCLGKDDQCTAGRYRGCRCYDPATRTTLSTTKTSTTSSAPTTTVLNFSGFSGEIAIGGD